MTQPNPKRAKRKPMPKHPTVQRAYCFPLETSPAESARLFNVLGLCWEAREAMVADRIDDRHLNATRRAAGELVKYLTKNEQYVALALLAKSDLRYRAVHSQVLQNVADRIDEGTKRWFDARKVGNYRIKPPHALDKRKYSSFTYTQYGTAAFIRRGVLHLSKLGDFRVRDYRKLRGKPKSVTLKFADGRWWAMVTCAIQAQDVIRSAAQVAALPDSGGDPGLSALLTVADGTSYDPPRALADNLSQLRHAQKDLSRKFEMRKKLHAEEQDRRKAEGLEALPPLRAMPYSTRLHDQIVMVGKLHTRVKNVRGHHHKKTARTLERTVRLLAMEEHGVQFMLRNRKQARSAADRGIYAFKQAVKSVMGERYLPVPNKRAGIGGNSQTCICDAPVPKDLKERRHLCTKCGLDAPRDQVSANIAMKIAFGTTFLTSPNQDGAAVPQQTATPATGQVVVRRGETKGVVALAAHPERTVVPATSEVSVKRHPLASEMRCENTCGGEPTQGAKTVRHRHPPLPAAAKSHDLRGPS